MTANISAAFSIDEETELVIETQYSEIALAIIENFDERDGSGALKADLIDEEMEVYEWVRPRKRPTN